MGYSPWGHKELNMTEKARMLGNFFVHQSLRTNTGLNDILEEKSEYDIVFLKLYMKSIV